MERKSPKIFGFFDEPVNNKNGNFPLGFLEKAALVRVE